MRIENQAVTTLDEFYDLMAQTRQVRLGVVGCILDAVPLDTADIQSLELAAEALKAIPTANGGAEVLLDENRKIIIDLTYEVTELEKDILFLTNGETAFEQHLCELHPSLEEQVEMGVTTFGPINLRNFITDRDGTVNNYCGRYLSSIQSVYNSVYIARFARNCVENTVILTSAPLENGGLVDITTIPDGIVINAGSKGREYRDLNFERGTRKIAKEKQAKLDELNSRLHEIIKQRRYRKFGLIGSGLQEKFGQTTVARQDVTGSVDDQESAAFFGLLEDLVKELDPDGHFFRIEDTGLDVEIALTVPSDDPSEGLTDFSKGNGVGFLNERLNLGLELGPNLICGDTGSDVPMLEECLKHSDETWAAFVTKDEELQERVLSVCERAIFLDEPDTLVSILNKLATRN